MSETPRPPEEESREPIVSTEGMLEGLTKDQAGARSILNTIDGALVGLDEELKDDDNHVLTEILPEIASRMGEELSGSLTPREELERLRHIAATNLELIENSIKARTA